MRLSEITRFRNLKKPKKNNFKFNYWPNIGLIRAIYQEHTFGLNWGIAAVWVKILAQAIWNKIPYESSLLLNDMSHLIGGKVESNLEIVFSYTCFENKKNFWLQFCINIQTYVLNSVMR